MLEQKTFYLTKKGFEDLKKEYEALKNLRVAKIKDEDPEIYHSENLEPKYFIFCNDLDSLESRLFELEYVFKNSWLIKTPSKEKQNIVDLGATVLLEEKNDKLKKIIEITITETIESDFEKGKISLDSPIGKALLNHKTGDQIIIPGTAKTIYKIKKIKY